MEILRRGANPWGQEVLIGIGWDLVWLALILSLAFVVLHPLWVAVRSRGGGPGEAPDGEASEEPRAGALPERIQRHSLAARAFHWTMSLAMLALLVTAFVPVLGLQFPWVAIHWIAGLVLLAAVVYHVVHSVLWQDFWSMSFGVRDVREGFAELRHTMDPRARPGPRAGKYPADHKLYHHLVVLVTVAALATGLLMMVRIDTPFWTRNPYLLSDGTWGVLYVVHGLAGVALIGLVAAHVYFAIRPEKRWITWSMIRGWITRDRYLTHHDPDRWVVK
ncbi:MAG: cytochrome b/b6 domain-containing protein [Gemmatimonadota bacterium]